MDDGKFLQYLQAKQHMDADFFPWQYPMQEGVAGSSTTTTSGWNQIVADAMADYGREQVHRNRELAELEASKMREVMNRTIHDQAFAHEILNVPNAEWKKTGDHFQRPYVETDGSFRVYYKGLVGETSVLGGDDVKKMTLAGIGVEICDTKDHQILKLQKPLELAVIVDGDSDVCVEFKALIEGPNAAVTLGVGQNSCFVP